MKHKILILIAVLILTSLACGLGEFTGMVGLSEPTAVNTEIPPTAEPTNPPPTATAEPTWTQEAPPTTAPTKPPPPTQTPTGPVYFREDFDASIDWTYEYIYGNNKDQCTGPNLIDGQLRWGCRSGEETQIRLYEDEHVYDNVVVQAEIENFGSNTNWTALMCRVNENGWIEFRFTTGGFYEIYRFDARLRSEKKNPYVYIGNGATPFLRPGKVTNVVAMVCQEDDTFGFYANGNQIEVKIAPKFLEQFSLQRSGGVGIGFQVMGDNPGPVDVGIKWFETFKP